jgi:transposase-like protein
LTPTGAYGVVAAASSFDSRSEEAMPKVRRKRTAYTTQKRNTILDAAQREGLTALQVQKKFGVTPVTYYSWRRKYGLRARRGGAALPTGGGLEQQVRSEVQTKVRQILPGIVRSEVSNYLDSLFRGRGRARKL